jgi:hypothetical protein
MFHRTFSRLTLLLILAGFRGSAGPLPATGFLQDIPFHGHGALFGGFSALHLSPDGLTFVALSDHGAFVTGQFDRDASGRILSISTSAVTPLVGRDAKPLRPGRNDSEGLAIAPDSTTYVSFEGQARVLHYSKLGSAAKPMPSHPDFAEMDGNKSLESLAINKGGELLTLPEDSGLAARVFPVYRFRDGVWDRPFTLPRRGSFLVSDATFGPDGRFYILERQFLGLGGFASRVRRFDLTPNGATNETTLLQTDPGAFDNLEGLAVWRDAKGLRATMVSDDNFFPFFRSQIVEYRLPD